MSEPTPAPACTALPIATGSDGHAYLGCDAAVALLRAIAESCRTLAADPDCDLLTAAAAIDMEADVLDCRAIALTRPPPGTPAA